MRSEQSYLLGFGEMATPISHSRSCSIQKSKDLHILIKIMEKNKCTKNRPSSNLVAKVQIPAAFLVFVVINIFIHQIYMYISLN